MITKIEITIIAITVFNILSLNLKWLFSLLQEIIKAYLMNRGVQGMTPNQYWEHMQNENFRPDALTIILLGLFLEINIDLITPTREWNLWDGFPPEIVLGYNGGSNFFPTATIRST